MKKTLLARSLKIIRSKISRNSFEMTGGEGHAINPGKGVAKLHFFLVTKNCLRFHFPENLPWNRETTADGKKHIS